MAEISAILIRFVMDSSGLRCSVMSSIMYKCASDDVQMPQSIASMRRARCHQPLHIPVCSFESIYFIRKLLDFRVP